MEFKKSPISIEDQVTLLKDRGLIIHDDKKIINYLSYISFYRLRAYTYPFQDNTDPNHPFIKSVSFDDILNFYVFDRQLRLIVFDAIERIEIAFRTQMINQCSYLHGSHWYEDESLFRIKDYFDNDIETIDDEIDRSTEVFIDHYYNKYDKPERPPVWMTLEIISLGTLSKLYHNLTLSTAKKIISGQFKLPNPFILESWMHSISNVRNICAHHSRLWNRKLAIAPQIPRYTQLPFITLTDDIDVHKPYVVLCCMAYLMDVISPGHHFKLRLFDLFKKYNQINIRSMGFPDKWESDPLWYELNT